MVFAEKFLRFSRPLPIGGLFGAMLGLSLALTACKSPGFLGYEPPDREVRDTGEKGADRKSAGKKDGAGRPCFGIVDGEITNDYPAVVFITMTKRGRPASNCTGFFVGPNLLLTASHCVDPSEFDGFIVSSLSQWDVRQGLPPGERPRQVIAPTIVRDVNTPEGRASDIAAMVFDKDIAPAIVPVLDRRPQKGDRFTIVGYGNTSASASQLDGPVAYKRHGRNVVGQAAGDVIRFVGPQTPGAGSFANDESGAAPGDSGGPLFIDGKAAGVTSGGHNFRRNTVENVYADITGSHGKRVLELAVAAGGKLGEPEVNVPTGEDPKDDADDADEDNLSDEECRG